MQKVTCVEDSSSGTPVSTFDPSVMPSSTVTQPDTLSPKSIDMSPPLVLTTPAAHSPAPTQMKSTLLPFIKQTSVVLPSPPPTSTKSAILSTLPSFDVTTTFLSTVSPTEPATATSLPNQPIIPTTEVSHITSSAKPTTAVLPATSSSSSAMTSTFDMHSKTNPMGNPGKCTPGKLGIVTLLFGLGLIHTYQIVVLHAIGKVTSWKLLCVASCLYKAPAVLAFLHIATDLKKI